MMVKHDAVRRFTLQNHPRILAPGLLGLGVIRPEQICEGNLTVALTQTRERG